MFTPSPYQQAIFDFIARGEGNAVVNIEGCLTIDHVVPLSRGGLDCLANIVPACRECNTRKRTQAAEMWFRKQEFFDEGRWELIVAITRSLSELYFVE